MSEETGEPCPRCADRRQVVRGKRVATVTGFKRVRERQCLACGLLLQELDKLKEGETLTPEERQEIKAALDGKPGTEQEMTAAIEQVARAREPRDLLIF
jgi:hypothetical protein